MNLDDLLFDKFLRDETRLFHGCDRTEDLNPSVIKYAIEMQFWALRGHLLDELSRSVLLASEVQTVGASHYLRFGVGRRLSSIWRAYRKLMSIAPPDRNEPLTCEEADELTDDLNSLYMNIRGTMDNLAWALLLEHAPEALDTYRKKHKGRDPLVALLPEMFEGQAHFPELLNTLECHKAWAHDFKSRRDPVAHRIPLYIPAQVLTPAEASEYKENMTQFWVANADRDFGTREEIKEKVARLGRFVPLFVLEPDQNPMPIYPTVSDDIAHLVTIFWTIDTYFQGRRSVAE